MGKYIPKGTASVVFIEDKFLKVVPELLSEKADTYTDLTKIYQEVTYINLPEEGFDDTALFTDKRIIEVLLEDGYVLSEEDYNKQEEPEEEN